MATIAGISVSGTMGVLTATVGPYQPFANVLFNIQISGTFVGEVSLQRSLDGGINYITFTPPDLTTQATFFAPATFALNEPDAAALYRLICTAYTSGTISGRIG